MQDAPHPAEVLAVIARFLRETVAPAADPHTNFQARVAAGALDIVARQLTLAPAADAAEHARLRELLDRDAPLPELADAFAQRVEAGELDLATPGVAQHLWAVTMAKLAVDQPKYSGYLDALDKRANHKGDAP